MSLKTLYITFYHKPQIGVLGAVGSGISYRLQHILTNEALLKSAAALGVYLGTLVALVSLITGMLRLYDNIRNRFKKPPHESTEYH